MPELATTYLSAEEIAILARALLALANHDQDKLSPTECSRLVWQQAPELGPLATHLAELDSTVR